MNFPAMHAPVFLTNKGVPYLKESGVVTIGITETNLSGAQGFLDGFNPALEYGDYLLDPTPLPSCEGLAKFAGQLCYMSLGPKRTMNSDAQRYFENIKSQAHGSVIEHANASFIFYGISRSCTHELVRHRAGFAYSQLSQRYVLGKMLRFVERPEYQADPELHERFLNRIEYLAEEYDTTARILLDRQKSGITVLSAEAKTDLRKRVNQAARSALPNEAEAPIVVTANVRAWRHFIEMRAAEHAEIEIRALAFKAFTCLKEIAPVLFGDYEVVDLKDGTQAVKTSYRKV